nr:MAG TPA: hypothetical protein [Caudoviricetes sp.]
MYYLLFVSKKTSIFALLYILDRRGSSPTKPLAFFYASVFHIRFRPPCGALMRPLPVFKV